MPCCSTCSEEGTRLGSASASELRAERVGAAVPARPRVLSPASPSRLVVASVAITLGLGGCAASFDYEAALTALPYAIQDSGRIVVDVMINGRGPSTFAIDTAASISFIVDDLRERLELRPLPGAQATVHGLVASGVYPLYAVDRLDIGGEEWVGAPLVSLPRATEATSNIDGILGLDFLRRYTLAFSSQERIVRLYAPGPDDAQSYRGWSRVPLRERRIGNAAGTVLFLDIAIGEQAVPALFDLGAGVNILNAAAARMLGLRAVDAAGTMIAGALGSAPILTRLDNADVSTGSIRWRDEIFLISDLAVFDIFGSSEEPLAIVGSGLFNQRDFVIDVVGKRLLIRSNMPEVPSSPAAPGD